MIGMGSIARNRHVPALRAHADQVAIRAICDPDPGALQRGRADVPEADAYSDSRALLADPAIDAVLLALPNHLHLEGCRQAAAAGKHILLEKPIARTPRRGGRGDRGGAAGGRHADDRPLRPLLAGVPRDQATARSGRTRRGDRVARRSLLQLRQSSRRLAPLARVDRRRLRHGYGHPSTGPAVLVSRTAGRSVRLLGDRPGAAGGGGGVHGGFQVHRRRDRAVLLQLGGVPVAAGAHPQQRGPFDVRQAGNPVRDGPRNAAARPTRPTIPGSRGWRRYRWRTAAIGW